MIPQQHTRQPPLNGTDADPACAGTTVTVEGVSAGYGSAPDVVGPVDLTARPGETTTLLGPNGCGKSTLLKTMSRQLSPRAGRVLIDDEDVHSMVARHAARTVAVLPQNPVAPEGLTVGELVARGRHPHRPWWRGETAADSAAIDAALEETSTTALVDRDMATLSGGQRQRVWLAMVLAQDTPVILLDEPTTYLDPAHAVEMLELVQGLTRRGRTVVMVLHDLMMAGAYSDRIIVLGQGRILGSGTPQQALTPETLAQTYRLRADVLDDPQGTVPIIVPRGTC
ncbi:ABC transporter ATP-binding protein [Tomitella cavernea]|uniref:ABC transporter ATP-binding protein n=1 Tax=Tomitella cavernea TaxID=1387982 RepID=A0ABP9CXQ2_9ACTN|nr:ABC transporter ATP-binding protein [Tomitella cavernea]